MKKVKKLQEQSIAQQKMGMSGAVVWEGDDSPKSYSIIRKMVKFANKAGGRVLRIGTYGVLQLEFSKGPMKQVINGISAGKFIYIPE